MPSWGSFFLYPPVTGITSPGLEYDTSLSTTRGREYANANLTMGLRRIGVGGGKLHCTQVDDWERFQRLIKGQWGRFLFRLDIRHFEMTDSLIGSGNGEQTQFQLKKTGSYPYGPANTVQEIVRFPSHDYPEVRLPGGHIWLKTEYVQLKAGTTLQGATPLSFIDGAFTVEREGGGITLAAPLTDGYKLWASCKFFILARQNQDYNPITATSEGHITYTIPGGIEIYEPRYQPGGAL